MSAIGYPSSTRGGGGGRGRSTTPSSEVASTEKGAFSDDIPLVMAETTTVGAASTDAPTATAVSLDSPAIESSTTAAADPEEILVVTFDGDVGGVVNETTPLVISSTAPPVPPRRGNNSIIREESDQQSQYSTISESGPVFRDWPFAVVFWIHLGVVVYVGVRYSSKGFQRMTEDFDYDKVQKAIAAQDDVTPEDLEKFTEFVDEVLTYFQGYPLRIFLYNLIPLALIVLLFLDLTIGIVLKNFPVFVVRLTLICSVIFPMILFTLLVISEPTVFSILLTMIIVGPTAHFVLRAWPLATFAAINLKFSVEALNSNMGIYLWSMFFSKFSVFWVIGWLYVFLGIHFLQHINCEETEHPEEATLQQWQGHDDDDCHLSGWTILLLLLSLYWTTNVIVAYVQVSVAGVAATWLFDKDAAKGCCSPAVWGSLQRAGTYSFGSICLGSLLQGFVGILRWFVQVANNRRVDSSNGEHCCGALCSCIVDCVAHVGGPILEYFSQWNYVYISIYGQSYLTSGKKVTELFKRKGWESIITERLDNYVLGWVTFAVGVVTGATALLVERIVTLYHPESGFDSWVYGPLQNWRLACFGIGMINGIVASSVMMRVIKGGINTLIVCWADHPHQIVSNHPKLSGELITAWSRAFPKSFSHNEATLLGEAFAV